jgi:undecaprenyl pyrophosphate synthase
VEGDKRAAEASKTAVKTFREKHNLDSNGKPIETKPTGDPDPDPDEPKWAKALREKLETQTAELNKKFEGLEKAKTQEQLMAKFQAKLKEKGVDELYIPIYSRNLVIESEDKLDQLVEDTDKVHKDFVQKSADKGVIISIPGQNAGPAEAGEATGKSIAEKRNKSATEGVPGKKV